MEKYLIGALVVFAGACCKEPEHSASRPPQPQAASRFPEVVLHVPAVGSDGAVMLAWEVRDVPSPIVKPDGCFILIERRTAGGAWTALTDGMISQVMRFKDTGTQPKTTYEYRAVLGILDPAWTPAKPGRLTDRFGGPVAVRTPGIWSIEFSNIQTFDDDFGDKVKPGQAYVIIRKYDKVHGLVEWRKIQHEGEDLGVIQESGASVSTHRIVTKDGKLVTVDFRVGGKFKKVTAGKMVLYDYQECNGSKLDQKQDWVCVGPQKKTASYKVNEVLYTDEDGKDQVYTKPNGPGPIADMLCQDHGGAPSPKEVPPEERLAQREKDADRLMDQADTLWMSEKAADQKKAQRIYQQLLASYVDLNSVKPRKIELTRRSNQKIDASEDPDSRVPSLPPEKNLKRAAEAARLLIEADALWESLDPTELKKAQFRYKHLLDHHADNPAVIRRRAELSHRSRQRVD